MNKSTLVLVMAFLLSLSTFNVGSSSLGLGGFSVKPDDHPSRLLCRICPSCCGKDDTYG